MKSLRIPLRVVFYREEGSWVAHCLEFDLCGDGVTKQEALESLAESIRIQIAQSLAHNNPSNLISPAPREVHEKFFAGKDSVLGELKIAIDASQFVIFESQEYREYTDDGALSSHDLIST